MDKNAVIEARKYKLKPTEEQKNKIIEYGIANRLMWNAILGKLYKSPIEKLNDLNKKNNTKTSLYKYLNHLPYDEQKLIAKPLNKISPKQIYNIETKLKFADISLYGYTKKSLKIAFDNHFKNPRSFKMPKFKKYTEQFYISKYTTIAGKHSYLKKENILKLSKVGDVKVINHYPSNGRLFKVSISRKPDNTFYTSLSFEQKSHTKTFSKTKKTIGIDLNVNNDRSIALNDGTFIKRPETKHILKKIDWESHRLGLKREQLKPLWATYITNHPDNKITFVEYLQSANNYQKQRLKIARLHHRLRNIIDYWIKSTASMLVEKYDIIVLEDLSTNKMLKNHHMARLLAQSHFRELRTTLEYKAEWSNKKIVAVAPEYTTQKCSNCGYIMKNDEKLKLSDTKWTCPNCRAYHLSDINAACNILNDGLKIKN